MKPIHFSTTVPFMLAVYFLYTVFDVTTFVFLSLEIQETRSTDFFFTQKYTSFVMEFDRIKYFFAVIVVINHFIDVCISKP